ncbi:MAG: ABC transporter ATP-binding protein [Pseudonocardia sp.]
MPDALVTADGLSKRYGHRDAVRDVSLTVAPGEVVGLIGPNGSGKSTLIHMLAGLVKPGAGTMTVAPRIGLVLEHDGHLPYLSAHRNLALLAALAGGTTASEIDDAIRRVGLDPADRRRVRRWSQGMRRRLTLAQSLLDDPPLLLLDEPTNSLDPAGVADFRDLLRAHTARGGGVLLASHALDELARVCDRVLAMRDGRVVPGPASAGRHVRIRVSGDIALAAQALPGCVPGEQPGELVVAAEEPVPDLVRRLVEAGVKLEMVLPDAHDLEARYLGLVT